MSHASRVSAITKKEIVQVVRNVADLNAQALPHRFYVGDELCDRRLPDIRSFKAARKKVIAARKKLSLLTPLASEEGFCHIRSLVALLGVEDEVIVNDFGVLSMIKSEFGNPVILGRSLTRNILGSLLQEEDKGNHGNVTSLLGNVKGLEADAFNERLITGLLSKKFNISYYCLSVLMAATNRCVFLNGKYRDTGRDACHKICADVTADIKNPVTGKMLVLNGNGLYEPVKLRLPVKHGLFDRLVLF